MAALSLAAPLLGASAVSALSPALTTVYYPAKAAWSQTYLHYGIDGQSWTPVPGVVMDDACAGWKSKDIVLAGANGVQVTFTNGSGAWDNNGGSNYRAGSGTVVWKDGQLTQGTSPCEPGDPAGTATIFYKSSWSTPKVHYRVGTGAWTNVPGVAMTLACDGWYEHVIPLGTATGGTVVFNDGNGRWDNNGGKDYAFASGTQRVADGVLAAGGDPCATEPTTEPTEEPTQEPTDDPGSTAKIFYATTWTSPKIHYRVGTGAWTTVPGVSMTPACAGWFAKEIDLGDATGGTVVFNNGSGSWDNNGGRDYTYGSGTSVVSGGVLAAGTDPCNQEPPVLDTTAPSVPAGVVATADGTRTTVSWRASTDDVEVAGYRVVRTGGAGTVTRDVTALSATDTGLLPETRYSYTVAAFDAAGNVSAASDPAPVTTGTAPATPKGGTPLGGDPREDSIYFVMTARFNDGDATNNRGGSQHVSSGNAANNDPMFRGDFKGLVDKLDYIKGLGFSAIWITPVVLNRSDYDFHGYHGWDFYRVDPRLESEGASYQELIDAAHAKGMKIYQDVVYNHSSRWGAKGLFTPTVWGDSSSEWGWFYSKKEAGREYDPLDEHQGNDPTLTAAQNALAKGRAYNGDLWSSTTPFGSACQRFGQLTGKFSKEGFALRECQWPSPTSGMFPAKNFHQCWIGNWEGKDAQDCWIHEDLADFNTENAETRQYLIDAYNGYIDMGVDGFRIDTAVHIPRVMWNRYFLPAIQEHATSVHGEKGKDFYVFGEVAQFVHDKWNRGSVNHSAPFYTWQERKEYALDDVVAAAEQFAWENLQGTANQPTSTNAFLAGADGNTYHAPDHSKFSGMNVIDMRMHMNFSDAGSAFWNGKDSDDAYNDATYNTVYVDSHDYGPNKSSVRYDGGTDAWAENMSLMWTFRGIPTLYYGSEIEFQAGKQIDCGPSCPLATTGRAYFGDHLAGSVTASDFGVVSSASGAVAATLQKPLVKHVQRLNLIRRAVPALQKGQYSTTNVDGDIAYKRRYTASGVDSFVLVTVSGSATFRSIPNGTYVDVVTGDRKVVTNGTLAASVSGKGNLRAYVLDTAATPAPGKIGEAGTYLK